MRKKLAFLLVIGLMFTSCGSDRMYVPGEIEVIAFASSSNAPNVETSDSLAEPVLNHIFLTINEIRIHKDGNAWETIAQPHEVFDFLQLTDTMTFLLADTLVPPGHYTQLRLIVADTNEVVIDGVSYPLTVPSGTQTGVKLNLDIKIDGGETAKVYLEFDENTAIVESANGYHLRPSFRLNIELEP
ncbi:MAG: DUF4382 domain-containing protein [Candidatus Zixiibacteriota bacterium]